jgi:hypothetical protein
MQIQNQFRTAAKFRFRWNFQQGQGERMKFGVFCGSGAGRIWRLTRASLNSWVSS